MLSSKLCSSCNEIKPVDSFYPATGRKRIDGTSTTYYRNKCKDCVQQDIRKRRLSVCTQTDKTQGFFDDIKKLYSMDKEMYIQFLASNGNRCQICGNVDDLVIDHNHNTGKVRGLLCGKCNKGLGLFLDSPTLLSSALEYINDRGNYDRT